MTTLEARDRERHWGLVSFLVTALTVACGAAGGTDETSAGTGGASAKGGSSAKGGAAGKGGSAVAAGGSDTAGAGGDPSSAGGADPTGGGGTTGFSCADGAQDSAGCACPSVDQKHACYTADPKTRNVGPCKDGVQVCTTTGELGALWGPCSGAITPVDEACKDGIDNDCNGLVDCADPGCADDAACAGACTDGMTRPCYGGPAGTAGVGACKAGTQTCKGGSWPATCAGQVLPAPETCAPGVDASCDGKSGCADPACATTAACQKQCTDGQTQPCYTGPVGSAGVGTCKGGVRTCKGGVWPTDCPGQVLPAIENCKDVLDHNCNGFKGCDDIFACVLDTYCWGKCTAPPSGCSCPVGSGDGAQCPDGTFGFAGLAGFGTGQPPEVACCPCTAKDCGNAGCCAEAVCKGNQLCAGFTCTTLPPSCGGKVDFDCDFEDANSGSGAISEDCDESCCKCRSGC